MTEVKNTAQVSPQKPPYHLKVSGGYRGLNLNEQTYHGAETNVEVGQSLPHDRKTKAYLAGTVNVGRLTAQGGSSLKNTGFGFKLGVERQVGSGASLSFWGFLGTEIFAANRVNPQVMNQSHLEEDIPISLENAAGLSLGLGGKLSFFKNIASLEGGLKGVLGIPGSPQTSYPWAVAYNSLGWFTHVGFDLAQIVSLKKQYLKPNQETFNKELQLGLIAETSYTYNFNEPESTEENPEGDQNTLRIFDTANGRIMGNLVQLSLRRPADENAPIGFGIAFDVGENANVSQASSSFAGNYRDLQQLYAEAYLPLGHGLTVAVGKIPTIIGLEVIEPINNQISRSWGFGLAIPFTHGGALASYPINDKVEIKAGVVNGWDNLYDRNTGVSGLYGLFVSPKNWASFSITGATGVDQSSEDPRLLNILDGIVTFSGGKRFPLSLTLNADWGYQGEGGEENPQAHWVAASVSSRIDFGHYAGLSGRGEIFHDPKGVRTDIPQTLWHGAGTVHLKPIPKKYFPYFPLEIRGELRKDSSTAEPYFEGITPSSSQLTLGVSAMLNFKNILEFWRTNDEED